MPEHIFTILCEKSVHNPPQALDLIGIAEDITIAGLPPRPWAETSIIIPFRFDLVSVWQQSTSGTPETVRQRVTLRDPSGHTSVPGIFPVNLENFRCRNTLQIQALQYRSPGEHVFLVEWAPQDADNWTHVARFPIRIFESDATPTPPQT